jgi:hypothetical protein
LNGRDPLDPDQVSNEELGVALRLTLDLKDLIEAKETEHRRKKGKPPSYKYSMRGIRPCEQTPNGDFVTVPPEKVAAHYRRRRNAETAAKKKTERNSREKAIMENQQTTVYPSHAEYRAAQKARTREQIDALIDASDQWKTAAMLMKEMRDRDDPAWRNLFNDEDTFYQTVITRLNMARDQGRTVERREPGPRGSELRLVRRTV